MQVENICFLYLFFFQMQIEEVRPKERIIDGSLLGKLAKKEAIEHGTAAANVKMNSPVTSAHSLLARKALMAMKKAFK